MADETGSVVRRLRLRAGLTQEGLAERSGVSVRTIRGIETGTRRNPQLASLVQLADALGLSAGDRHDLLRALGVAPPPVRESPHLSTVLTPRQLPAGAVGFAGREGYLDRLDALLGAGPHAVVISGAGGVGKTALALRWTHRVGHRYPDGHLYVNLNGYSPEPPMTPADVLPMFLRALGVAQAAIPLTVAEQAAYYRSVLSDKRALIVLDNAAAADQIRPLLPGSPGCLVLITSRDDLLSLTALDGAQRLVLDVLSTDEAHQALTLALGESRVEAEPEATAELARLCGRLPLALRIAAAQLAGQRQTIAGYVADLTVGNRLSRLAIGQDRSAAVRASFELSYQRLDPRSARLFRLLGCAPCPDYGVPAIAKLTGFAPDETALLLERLASMHLVETPWPGRYVLHDLLRLYAGECARHEDSAADREAALRRLFDMYLHTADAATRLMYPAYLAMLPGLAGSGEHALSLEGFDAARSWLDGERGNLVAVMRYAADHGPGDLTWRLVTVLSLYFHGGMYRSEWLEAAELGHRAACEAGDSVARAVMLHVLHRAHFVVGDYDKALEFGLKSRELFPTADHPGGEAEICKQFGYTYWLLGHPAESLANFTRARDLSRAMGNRAAELFCLNGMSVSYVDWGRLTEAIEHANLALALHLRIGVRLAGGAALHVRSYANAELGHVAEAIEDGMEALVRYREAGFRFHEASMLSTIAGVHRETGRTELALRYGYRALRLAKELNDSRGRSNAHSALAGTHLALGELDEALAHVEEAVRVARETGYRRGYVDALIWFAAVAHARGDDSNGIDRAEAALRLARERDFRMCVARALTVLAEIDADRGDLEAASVLAAEASALYRRIGCFVGDERAERAARCRSATVGSSMRAGRRQEPHDPAAG